jgi:hypothetical protein
VDAAVSRRKVYQMLPYAGRLKEVKWRRS